MFSLVSEILDSQDTANKSLFKKNSVHGQLLLKKIKFLWKKKISIHLGFSSVLTSQGRSQTSEQDEASFEHLGVWGHAPQKILKSRGSEMLLYFSAAIFFRKVNLGQV